MDMDDVKTSTQIIWPLKSTVGKKFSNHNFADCIGLPITLQITARVTWSGWPRIARSHTEISLSLSELLHRGTNLAFKLE